MEPRWLRPFPASAARTACAGARGLIDRDLTADGSPVATRPHSRGVPLVIDKRNGADGFGHTCTRRSVLPQDARNKAPLPDFDQSDEVLQNLLANLFGSQAFQKCFNPNEIVRHFVVTVDNLPRQKLNREQSPARPVERAFITAESGGTTVIAPANAVRYAAWIAAAEAVDAKKLVMLYVRFYPWFEQE